MSIRRVAVHDIHRDGTFGEIKDALAGSLEGKERERRFDDLSASIRSRDAAVEEAVHAGVEDAVAAGLITEDEAARLLEPRP